LGQSKLFLKYVFGTTTLMAGYTKTPKQRFQKMVLPGKWFLDSATKGTYKETATGHRISFDTKEVRYVRDWVNGQ